MRTRTTYEIMLRYPTKNVTVFDTIDQEEAYEQYEIWKDNIKEFADVVLLKLEWHCVSTTPLQCS